MRHLESLVRRNVNCDIHFLATPPHHTHKTESGLSLWLVLFSFWMMKMLYPIIYDTQFSCSGYLLHPCDLISDASCCRHIVNKILNVHAPGNVLAITESMLVWPLFDGVAQRQELQRSYISYFTLYPLLIHYRMVWWGPQHCLFIWWEICICCLSCYSLRDWCRGTILAQLAFTCTWLIFVN